MLRCFQTGEQGSSLVEGKDSEERQSSVAHLITSVPTEAERYFGSVRSSTISARSEGVSEGSKVIRGTSGYFAWILTSQKKIFMRQRIFQPPSSSPARSAVTAEGRLNLFRGDMNISMNGVV